MKNVRSIISSNIRIDEEDWDMLRIIADYNKRSINNEIAYLIQKEIEEFEEMERKKNNDED